MILSSTQLSASQLQIRLGGTDIWRTMLAVQLAEPCQPGDRFLLVGRLQAKCYEKFAVEFCLGLHATPDVVPPMEQITPAGRILPVVGENIAPETPDKYVVLHENAIWECPINCSSIYFALRARARSTQAVAASRLDFGNGALQVTRL